MRKIFGHFFLLYYLLVFTIGMIPVLIFHIFVKLVKDEKKRLRLIYRVHRWWILSCELLAGVRMHVSGHDKINPDQSYVFVANHNNMLDIPLVGSTIQHPWKSLAKREILNIPLIGWIIGNISLMVDRSSRDSRSNSLISMQQHLRRGISILVFPEGTRNRSGEALKRFHPGAFRTAISTQLPIMPIVILGIRSLQPVDTFELYPGPVEMRFLDPIPTKGLTEADQGKLMKEIFEKMEAEILRLDPEFATQQGSCAK